MKRSEINELIRHAERFFEDHQFFLPPWAHWTPDEWKETDASHAEIIENALGWDITDFGSDDFFKRGLLLFTIRNGSIKRDEKPYAEKIMIVREGQETPYHFHWNKMEDIINRGGGNLVLELYGSEGDETLSEDPVTVSIDGIRKTYSAGEKVILEPGESICLTQGLYHRFYGERGDVLTGEVSVVNDDAHDNRFHEELPRFPGVDEDEPPYRLLTMDYANWITR